LPVLHSRLELYSVSHCFFVQYEENGLFFVGPKTA
jgi:hypothetical protein